MKKTTRNTLAVLACVLMLMGLTQKPECRTTSNDVPRYCVD